MTLEHGTYPEDEKHRKETVRINPDSESGTDINQDSTTISAPSSPVQDQVMDHLVLSSSAATLVEPDDQTLLEDDLYILGRIKESLLRTEVSATPTSFPPSIVPKGMRKGKLTLLDIDPLELARQLTLMEFALYRKITAIECLQRSRQQKVGEHKDHITDVIQMTNKVRFYYLASYGTNPIIRLPTG